MKMTAGITAIRQHVNQQQTVLTVNGVMATAQKDTAVILEALTRLIALIILQI